ncbi:glycine-rich cell wall structural protein-like [Oryza brachyantha]|uniref:glycine-rich cell wall structural protein-like n=1 Tax=Oryza brachyantha TaxID=4533 RepID=UPI001ADAC862|nr:glycine-rich cell wall structural protein-like [Oryza brachyantha]
MASNKALVAFAVLLAAAFLVAADETQAGKKEEAKVDVQDYWRGGGYPRGGYPGGGYPGGGYPRGGYPGGGYPRGGYGYPGGGWRGGCRCCGYGYRGGCRCCASPDEVPEPMYRPEVELHN